MDSFTCATGIRMPQILYGTAWKKADTEHLVATAIRQGFRGLDTACQPKHYEEAGVGTGIAAALAQGLTRDDLYLQTKFTPLSGQDPQRIPYDPAAALSQQVAQSCEVSLQNLPVVFALDRAGLVGGDGATHQGSYDYSFLRCIPNIVVMAPADENECRQMLYTAFTIEGPSAVRYPRGAGPGAELHQQMAVLPVGRGEGRSVCLLLRGAMLSEMARARLALMRETNDGFRIAEEDLRLRGAGEVLGTRQSGLPVLRLADLAQHEELVAVAHDDARLILARDPDLSSPRGEALRLLLYLFRRDEAVQYLRAG